MATLNKDDGIASNSYKNLRNMFMGIRHIGFYDQRLIYLKLYVVKNLFFFFVGIKALAHL